jgi:hypothetical protein
VAWTNSRLQGSDIVHNGRYLVGPEPILRKGRCHVGTKHRKDSKRKPSYVAQHRYDTKTKESYGAEDQ